MQLPEGWQELFDPSGKVYYANAALGVSQWVHPGGINENQSNVSEQPASCDPSLSASSSGDKSSTGASDEALLSSQKSQTVEPARRHHSEDGAAIARRNKHGEICWAQWRRILDKGSGKHYYAHRTTRETRWEAPDGFQAAAEALIQQESTNNNQDRPISRLQAEVSNSNLIRSSSENQESVPNRPCSNSESALSMPEKSANGLIPGSDASNGSNKHVLQSNDVVQLANHAAPNQSSKETHKSGTAMHAAPVAQVAEPVNGRNAGQVQSNTDDIHQDNKHSPSTASLIRRRSLPPNLISEIHSFNPDNYAKTNFRVHKKGIFGLKQDKDFMQFSKSGIKKSILRSDHVSAEMAIKCFKLVRQVMGDSEPNVSLEAGAIELLSLLGERTQLVDECYGQVIKQLLHNPDWNSESKGWCIFALLAGLVGPITDFVLYTLHFLREHAATAGSAGGCSIDNHSQLRQRAAVIVLSRLQVTLNGSMLPSDRWPSRAEDIRGLSAVVFGESPYLSSLDELESRERTLEKYGLGEEYSQAHTPRLNSAPWVLNALLDGLSQNGGFTTEGIFRLASDADDSNSLRNAIENGAKDLSKFDCITLGNELKRWLRNLKEPVIPFKLHSIFEKKSHELSSSPEQLLEWLALHLPAVHWSVLQTLLHFLACMCQEEYSSKTRMDVQNLGKMFAPNLTQSQSVYGLDHHTKAIQSILQHVTDRLKLQKEEQHMAL